MIRFLGRAAILRLLLRAAETGPARGRVTAAETVLGDRRLLSFARGLSLGALVGAAIAGLGIWSRFRRSAR